VAGVYSLRHDITVETLWEELKDCFRSLLLKAIAVRDEDDIWKNVLITGLLTCEEPERLKREVEEEFSDLVELGVTELDDLIILYDVLSSEEFPNVIHELQGGNITISNQYIKLRDPNGKVEVSPYTYFIYRDLHEFPRVGVIIGSRTAPSDLKNLKRVEEELKSLGYYDIEELGFQWLKVTNLRGLSLEATIAIPIYLSNTVLEFNKAEGTIRFRAKVHKALLPKLRLLIALREKHASRLFTPVEMARRDFNELITRECTRDFVIVEFDYKFKKLRRDDHICYRIFGRLGILEEQDIPLERLLPEVPILQRLFTEFLELDELMEILEEKKIGGHIRRPELAFQRAVAWLFTLLGYKVIELEGTDFKEFVDLDGSRREVDMILYDDENNRIYIVDCTIRAPEPKKVDDIANAKESLLRKGMDVEPLIVVGESALETKKNVRRVKVLDLEDLKKMISYLKQGDVNSARELLNSEIM